MDRKNYAHDKFITMINETKHFNFYNSVTF